MLGLVFTAYVPCTYAVKYVNFGSTGAMVCWFKYRSHAKSFHTRSCFHRQRSMHVCCKIRQLWVDRSDGLWIFVPVPWPKVFILVLVFTAYVPCTFAVKYVNFGFTGAMVCGFFTVSMTQSFHTMSCFQPLFSMHVCSEIRKLWVDRGDGL